MPSWHFRITPEGEDDLDSLDKNLRKRVIEKLKWLVENFDKVTPLPLGGQWRGFFKLRVGDWRIIYQVDNDRTYALGVIPAPVPRSRSRAGFTRVNYSGNPV